MTSIFMLFAVAVVWSGLGYWLGFRDGVDAAAKILIVDMDRILTSTSSPAAPPPTSPPTPPRADR